MEKPEATARILPSRAVAERLRTLIAQERLAPGSKIPSERNLSRRYGVARNTVREAIRILVDEGLLFANQGRGTLVLESFLTRDYDSSDDGDVRRGIASMPNLTVHVQDALRDGKKEFTRILADHLVEIIGGKLRGVDIADIRFGSKKVCIEWDEKPTIQSVVNYILPGGEREKPGDIPGMRLIAHRRQGSKSAQATLVWLVEAGTSLELHRQTEDPLSSEENDEDLQLLPDKDNFETTSIEEVRRCRHFGDPV